MGYHRAMGDVVNLNRFRKRKREEEAARVAKENSIRHGRTRAERQAQKRRREKQESELDGARLSSEEDDEPTLP
jgi:hypothetical protein